MKLKEFYKKSKSSLPYVNWLEGKAIEKHYQLVKFKEELLKILKLLKED